MGQQLSFDILIQKFAELPPELREAIARPETADTMNEIALRSSLTGPELSILASQTGLVMGGVISISEYVATLRGELRFTDERLKTLVQDVTKLVLVPINSPLAELHGKHWREILENTLLNRVPATEASPAKRLEPTRPSIPTPEVATLSATKPPMPPLVLPREQPTPATHQAPPPPSITMLEPHPVAPAFPSAQPPAPMLPQASATATPTPQFRPITIPEPQLAQKPAPTPQPKKPAESATNIIQAHYGGLSPAVRDAIKDIPISDVLFEIGEEQQLNVEQMGKMADTVMRFIAGKATQEEFLDTLLEDVFGGFRQKSAIVSQEINAKIFTPIRKALKVTTAEPTESPKPSAPRPETPLASAQPKPQSTGVAPAPTSTPKTSPPDAGKIAPAQTPVVKIPSEPEPWIIYPLRSQRTPSPTGQQGINPAEPTSPVAIERPDRAGWGDAYPPIDHEVIPPIRPEGTTATPENGRGVEPPANLPTEPAPHASAPRVESPKISSHPPVPPAPEPRQAPAQQPKPTPKVPNTSHDPYREPAE